MSVICAAARILSMLGWICLARSDITEVRHLHSILRRPRTGRTPQISLCTQYSRGLPFVSAFERYIRYRRCSYFSTFRSVSTCRLQHRCFSHASRTHLPRSCRTPNWIMATQRLPCVPKFRVIFRSIGGVALKCPWMSWVFARSPFQSLSAAQCCHSLLHAKHHRAKEHRVRCGACKSTVEPWCELRSALPRSAKVRSVEA